MLQSLGIKVVSLCSDNCTGCAAELKAYREFRKKRNPSGITTPPETVFMEIKTEINSDILENFPKKSHIKERPLKEDRNVEEGKVTEGNKASTVRAVSPDDLVSIRNARKFRIRKKPKFQIVNCPTCGKTLLLSSLRHHMTTHTKSEPIICTICGKLYKSMISLHGHKRIHMKESNVCSVCGMQFEYKSEYNYHMRKHSVKHRVICSICGKSMEAYTLKKHMRVHTGERPYKCKYCEKGFSSSNALKTHIRRHTKETPYTCQECPAAFYQRVSLKNHLRNKHDFSPPEVLKIMEKFNIKINRL